MVCCSGNDIGNIKKVKLHQAHLLLGLVTTFVWCNISVFPDPRSLAIPPCVGGMSTGDGFGHSESHIVVSPATTTAGVLADIGYRCWLSNFELAIRPTGRMLA